MPPMSIAELLPRVRQVLPLTDIDALTRLTTTLCDVLETTLAVLPAPTNEAVAVPALTPQNFYFRHCWTGRGRRSTSSAWRESDTGGRRRSCSRPAPGAAGEGHALRFGPGGHWIWKLPEEATDKAIYFHPGEWRSFIVGHRHKFPALPVGI